MKKTILFALLLTSSISQAYRDTETGTFLTRDPIGYQDGPNLYCYVHCNPITAFDPLGLEMVIEGSEEEREQIVDDIQEFAPDVEAHEEERTYVTDTIVLEDGTKLDITETRTVTVLTLSASDVKNETDKQIKALIDSKETYTVKYGETGGLNGPAEYNPNTRTVTLEKETDWVHKHKGFDPFNENNIQQLTYPMLLAHEILGRAYGHEIDKTGYYGDRMALSDRQMQKLHNGAVKRADVAWKMMGKEPREKYISGDEYSIGSLYQKYYGVPTLQAISPNNENNEKK